MAEKTLSSGQGHEIEFHRSTTFGKSVWLKVYLTTFRSQNQQHLLGIFDDISERKFLESETIKAEDKLRESESKFRQIFESNMLAIAFWDVDGGITEANDAFLSIIDYTQNDLEDGLVDWRKLTPPEHVERDHESINELIQTGSASPFEKDYFKKDGSRSSDPDRWFYD